ncbi:putative zinc metalloprotease egy2, chloroplastic [Sarracenia purpurea var. burkii]
MIIERESESSDSSHSEVEESSPSAAEAGASMRSSGERTRTNGQAVAERARRERSNRAKMKFTVRRRIFSKSSKLLLGDVLKEGTPISLNPLVIWAWAGLLINAINSIPAGELDGGRISFAIWGRKVSARLTSASIALLGLSSLFNDVAFYWVVLIFFLQRGPIAPLSEEITEPDNKYVALGVVVLLFGLLVCSPYPFSFTSEAITSL